jgi:hypothetical protein
MVSPRRSAVEQQCPCCLQVWQFRQGLEQHLFFLLPFLRMRLDKLGVPQGSSEHHEPGQVFWQVAFPSCCAQL